MHHRFIFIGIVITLFFVIFTIYPSITGYAIENDKMPIKEKPEKMLTVAEKGDYSKMSSMLREKALATQPQESVPVIIFLKNNKEILKKNTVQQAAEFKISSTGGNVKYKYNIINAIAGSIPAGRINDIAAMPEVERIYYDEIVSLPPEPPQFGPTLANSTQTIGANYAWNTLGYTGLGVKVAVIDTGINYSHPDLGGGFGPGYKVVGGYDFVNNDNDPMDDNDHGTHVAGIVAANGTIKGVAPNATLLAVKVLGSNGSGSTSNVIAGIDWSVANGANIISMSLGGSSQPNDEFASPTNIVADAAVDRGVVVVIAAGNEGPGTQTIAQPASAKKVITVGASNSASTVAISDDTIATFSSRGPSAFGRLDPELVTPGVNINSTWRTGGYNTSSGTSMATPHVAGAAALLLQKNPSMNPAEVRRTLMQTASDVGAGGIHVFSKGAGIINVTKALTYNISAIINNDDRWEVSVLPGYNATTKIFLRNNGNSAINFTYLLTENISDLEGDKNIDNSSFILPAYTTVNANSNATVDITISLPSDVKPAVYGTTLIIKDNTTNQMLRIPIVITVPLFGPGIINGTTNEYYYCQTCGDGDWIYYKLKSHNGTVLNVTMTWTDSNDNLDLYLFSPNGLVLNESTSETGTEEHLTLSNMVYDEYWIAMHAYNLTGGGMYNITVNYTNTSQGGLAVSPNFWQGTIAIGQIKNITFNITNDAIIKNNLNISVRYLQSGDSFYASQNISANSATIVWSRNENGPDMNFTRYLNATLRWNNSNNNVDLYFAYKNASNNEWYLTRFSSEHWNNGSVPAAIEELKMIDIQHYLKNPALFSDVGILVNNAGSQTVNINITINLTDALPWSAASVNESIINLSSGEVKHINVSLDGGQMTLGKTYNAILSISDANEDFATVDLQITPTGISVCLSGCTYSSIQNAINNVSAGDTISVLPGFYNETIVVNKSLNIIGESMLDVWVNASDASKPVFNITADYTNITGFRITGSNTSAGIYVQANHTKITGNNISFNYYGIYIVNSSANIINNNIANSNSEGITLHTSSNNSITNNIVNNNNYAINLSSSFNNIISDNTVKNNTKYGIWFSFSNSNTLTNNTANNNINGISFSNSTNNTLISNTILNSIEYDFYVDINSTDNIIHNTTLNNSIISFTGEGISLKSSSPIGSAPAGYRSLGKYVNITNLSAAGSWIFLNITYSDSDVVGMNENKLSIWRYNSSAWSNWTGVNGVNTAGKYVYANLTNFSIFDVFGLDDIAPSITISSPTNTTYSSSSVALSVSANEPVSSWWYSLDDGPNTTFTPNTTLSGLSNGLHTLIVYANDSVGNIGSASVTFIVNVYTPPPTGGGGGGGGGSGSGGSGGFGSGTGGGGGGVLPSTNVISETKTISVIPSNGTSTVIITRAVELGIKTISITVINSVSNVQLIISNATKPAGADDVIALDKGKVYKYIDISKKNITDNDISLVTIKIQVKKSWLTEDNIDENKIYLYRYISSSKSWTKLPTTQSGDDGTYVYYDAQSPGLSIFAIAGELKQAAAPQEKPTVNETQNKTATTTEGGRPDYTWMLMAGILIVIFILISAGYYLYGKKYSIKTI